MENTIYAFRDEGTEIRQPGEFLDLEKGDTVFLPEGIEGICDVGYLDLALKEGVGISVEDGRVREGRYAVTGRDDKDGLVEYTLTRQTE